MLNKSLLAYMSFIASIAFAIAGLVLPPMGVIDETVLVYTAQLLLFSAVMLGVSIDKAQLIASIMKRLKNEDKEKEELP